LARSSSRWRSQTLHASRSGKLQASEHITLQHHTSSINDTHGGVALTYRKFKHSQVQEVQDQATLNSSFSQHTYLRLHDLQYQCVHLLLLSRRQQMALLNNALRAKMHEHAKFMSQTDQRCVEGGKGKHLHWLDRMGFSVMLFALSQPS
jgi:hypothetical protein